MATYHFRMSTGRAPTASSRLISLEGMLDVLGEDIVVKIDAPFKQGVWCAGKIAATTLLHFKPGNNVRMFRDISTVILEQD